MNPDPTPQLPPVLPEPIGWKSIAWWPYPDVQLYDKENKSEDKHHDEESARAVCQRLQREGFGGERKIFPTGTAVEPIYAEPPIALANGIGVEAISKERCMRLADLEGDTTIGAGSLSALFEPLPSSRVSEPTSDPCESEAKPEAAAGTPRTDAHIESCVSYNPHDTNFARQLERELSQANAANRDYLVRVAKDAHHIAQLEQDLAAAREEISGLEAHFKIVRDDRDRAVAFANRIERGEIKFEGLAQKELKKILILGLPKDINEGLGDVVVREIQRLRAALEGFIQEWGWMDGPEGWSDSINVLRAALAPASSGKGEG